jgi:hypothetical protein
MTRTTQSTSYRPLLLAVAVVLALGVGTTSARAAGGIEGVWSFNGGQIAVQRLSHGTYGGTVVAETKFAQCAHPLGQQIWTGMTEQPDGSYWGLHQWYTANCVEDPVPGPTAWRVVEQPNHSRYMRVCFSHPGTSQPTIAANGAPKIPSEYAAHHVTFGCYSSALIASLPRSPKEVGKDGKKELLTLPSAKKCLGGRYLRIRLRDPKYDPLKTVTITLNGQKIATSRKGKYVVATINLKRLPKGVFKVKVHATTVLGHHLSASRTYHTCVGKTKSKKRSKKS